MHAFPSVCIIVTLALTANASSMYQRDTSPVIKTCADDLTNIGSSKVISNLNGLTADDYDRTIDAALKSLDSLNRVINQASNNCCFPAGTQLNAEDNTYLYSEAGKFVKMAEDITSAFARIHKDDVASNYEQEYTQFISDLKPVATKLDGCLADNSPADKKAETTAYTANLKIALDKASALYPTADYKNY